ncbi:MAG: NAD(P)/FAD-dependent oxidoreductase, partial [Acidimicrobiales bacterium]
VPRAFGTAISSVESLRHWATHPVANPPNLTHDGENRLTRHLYGRQRPNGEIVFGGDRRLFDGERVVDDGGIAVNFSQAAEILPVLRDLTPIRTWTGVMPWTADGQPVLGALDGTDGVYVAAGLASSGFTRGPMTGHRLASLITKH